MWRRIKGSYWPLFNAKTLFTTSGQEMWSNHKKYDLGGKHGLPEIVSDCPISKGIVLFLINEASNGSCWHVRTLNQLQGNFRSGIGPKNFAINSCLMPLNLRDYFVTNLIKIIAPVDTGHCLRSMVFMMRWWLSAACNVDSVDWILRVSRNFVTS